MLRRRMGLLIASYLLVATTAFLALKRDIQSKETTVGSTRARLHVERNSATDLEVGGQLDGVPMGSTRYLSREDLLALPQVRYLVQDDPNFLAASRVQGVLLKNLLGAVGAAPTANLVVAICDDKYRTNYPEEYMARHHPLLVLEVNGMPPSGWPKDSSGQEYEMGPYMISHPSFTPAFKILSHSDEAQIPWGVVRLEFRNQEAVFGAISPPGPGRNHSAVQAGFRIAQQNCFRCHNMGNEGGQKSGVPWQVLAQVAAGSGQWFSAYVRHPKSKNPQAQMPGNAAYDDETLRALVAYFRTFAEQAPAKN